MGIVYEAEQTAPVQRRVALKVIRADLDSREVVARFETERQALAVMSHESIAKVLDAGATDTGRPFFVMELVPGVPISDYCDRRTLSTRERVALFIRVCEAVQHAHQKGVIHRDLKPNNVLVEEAGGKPLPKVIDFGIAKAAGLQRLSEQAHVTQYGEVVGTPAYMSPEQAEMSGLDVDTRTDIYSLGVMLYELLVGRLPEDPQELGLPGFMARLAMMATDPPVPSAKLTSLVHHRETLAKLRNTDADGLRRELRGDLDWIVMRAIERDRSRRYETANGLALDLQHYLRDEPVTARPPSVRYRARKFVRRHRVGVVAGAAVAVAILAGTVATALALVRATSAEARARSEAATATQVSDFLVSLFQLSDPGEARGHAVTAREILDSGARKVEADLARQPLVQARLMKTMGEVYREMGLYDEASRLLTRSLATRERMLGARSPEVGGNLAALGRLYSDQARYAEAESTLIRAVTLLAAPRDERDVSSDPFAALSALGTLYQTTGRYVEADSVTRKALAALERMAGPDDPRLANQYNVLAILQAEQGRPAAAESLFRQVLAIRERAYGADHPDVSRALSNLGSSLVEQGKFPEAETLYRRALELDIRILGPEHSQVAFKLYNLANLREERGHLEEAIEHYRRASAIWEKSLGPDHPNIASALTGLATVYNLQGRSAEAVPVLQRALAIREKNLAPGHPFVATTLHELGKAETRLHRFAEAETHLRRALDIRRKSLDPASYHTSLTVYALANLHAERNQYADADSLYRQALAQWDASGNADAVARGEMVRTRAALLRRQGRETEARSVEVGR